MDFFRFIPREEVKGQGDSVLIHEQPHLNNGVRAVVLLRAAFAVLYLCRVPFSVNRPAVVIEGIHVGSSDIKIIVCTVKVGDRHVPFTDFRGMAVDPFLELFIILVKYIQGFVGIFQGKPVHVLKISRFVKESIPFGAGIEDAGKYQETENGLKVVLDGGLPEDKFPELIQFKLFIKIF